MRVLFLDPSIAFPMAQIPSLPGPVYTPELTSSGSLIVAGSTEQESTGRSGMNFLFPKGFLELSQETQL